MDGPRLPSLFAVLDAPAEHVCPDVVLPAFRRGIRLGVRGARPYICGLRDALPRGVLSDVRPLRCYPVLIYTKNIFPDRSIYSSTLAYIVDANVGRSSAAVASNSFFRGVSAFVATEIAVPLQVRPYRCLPTRRALR